MTNLFGTATGIENKEEEGLPAPLWHFASLTILFLFVGGIVPGVRHIYALIRLNSGVRIFSALILLNILFTSYALWGFHLNGKTRRLFSGDNRSWRPVPEDLWIGVALGLGLLITSIVIASMFPGGHNNLAPSLAKTGLDRIVGMVMIFIVSICEEVQDRGYYLQQFLALTRNTGFAVVLQAVFFVLLHGLDQGLSGYLARFVIGIAFGVVAIQRDSIWPSAIAHILINSVAFIAGIA